MPKKSKELIINNLKKSYPFFRDLKLKPRQIRFIYHYCTSLNGIQSLKQAGYKAKTDKSYAVTASRMLNQVNVKKAIRLFFDIVLDQYKEKLEKEIFDIVYRMMTYDPAMFIKKDGTPNFDKLEDIPGEWRCCIKSIKTRAYGKDAIQITELELVDREQAIEKLAKYITMFNETLDINHKFKVSDEDKKRLAIIFNEHKPPPGQILNFKKKVV